MKAWAERVILDQVIEQRSGVIDGHRQSQQIAGDKSKECLADRVALTAVAKKSIRTAGNHQSRTPCDHRHGVLLLLQARGKVSR